MSASTEKSTGSDARGASALRNSIAVLRSFSVDEPELGVSEIALRVGLHKSSVSRILATLEEEDLVERDSATRRFRLGLGIMSLAGPLLADLDVRRVAYPVLQELSERTGETSALMVWNGTEAVCVEQVPSRHLVKHTTPLGTRFNTALSSSVEVFLAAGEQAQARDLLSSGAIYYPGLDESGLEAYLFKLQDIAARGYAINYGGTSVEEVGVSSPVHDHRGSVIAAVLISAPRFRISRDQLSVLGEACVNAAQQVSSRLGGTPTL
ncbi:IclR family transcriptional regulator [Salinibacterium sp. ZJ454]|uniref:IclR family transcriptional regulator n=1 Tax=Salinibacterium sp. ZJ454 TaxID=2708339 RepID=UPI00142271FD|nr:IclR family transcriptional regulator [Salinibacterium sp. ZJ454]